jgi:hypothetical protein
MRAKAALVAGFVVALAGRAEADYYYRFATNGQEFWRPASGEPSDALLDIRAGSITLATGCFSSSMMFQAKYGRAASAGGQYSSSSSPTQECAAERSDFDALRQTLAGVTGSRPSAEGIVLQGTDGNDVLALAPRPPDGIEYRRLTVTAFRYGGKLLPLRNDPNFLPSFVLYGGRIEGSSGCGGLIASYEKLAYSRYKFSVGSILAGMCADINRALWRVDKICRDFSGVRDVETRGDDFVLRDKRGREQIVLSPITEGDKR